MGELTLWGAQPREWDLLLASGVGGDLLPVVSAPGLPVSPRSRLKEVGKVPSLVDGRGFVVGLPGWTGRAVGAGDLAKWRADNRLGLCLRTRVVRAIDVDVPDGAISGAVRELVELLAGPLPVRWRSNSGKLLIAFAAPSADRLPKRVMTLPEGRGIVELLADGQQFIAAGTHTSGVRYQWDGLDVLDVLGGWPQLSLDELDALWTCIAELTEAKAGKVGRAPVAGAIESKARASADRGDDPVADWLEEQGLVIERGMDGRLDVVCPWSAEHTSDSGPSSTSWFPAGVGGYGMGHFRCLHAHCADRSDEEFLDAVGYVEALFEKVEGGAAVLDAGEVLGSEEWPRFARDKAGRILVSATSLRDALSCPSMMGVQLAFDSFGGRVVVGPVGASVADAAAAVGRGVESPWRPIRDTDHFDLRVRLEARGFKTEGLSSRGVSEAARYVADANVFDSGIEWGKSLAWDGVPRVDGFLVRYLGAVADRPEYLTAVSRYLWTALAGRLMHPGCKVDMVPVLVGGEGVGKTSLVEMLAPRADQFVEINLGHRDDVALAKGMRGKLVGEIAELRGMQGRDREWVKAFVTRRFEEFRELYVEHSAQYPRRLVMVGTANIETAESMLSQDGEERRWLPVEVTGGSEQLRAEFAGVRDQLWAEGIALWRAAGGGDNGVQWRDAHALAKDVRDDFRSEDTWTERIRTWIEAGDGSGFAEPGASDGGRVGLSASADGFTTAQVLAGALGLAIDGTSITEQYRVGRVLRALGYVKTRPVRGKPRVWVKDSVDRVLRKHRVGTA